ncbi:MAG TPA: phage major capsid protein [Chloroflexota bacterium]
MTWQIELSDGHVTDVADDLSVADMAAYARERGLEIKMVNGERYRPPARRQEGQTMGVSYDEMATLTRVGMDSVAQRLDHQLHGLQAVMVKLSDDLHRRGFREDAGLIRDRDGAALWPVAQSDPALARAIHASMEPEYKTAWHRWLGQAAQHGGAVALRGLDGSQQKALSEGSDTAGGYLVPAELAARVLTVIRERSTVRAGALVVPTGRDEVRLGAFDFAADWQGSEVDTAGSETTITPLKSVCVHVMKARVKSKISNNLLADQPALEAYLADAGGAELALLEDQAFIGGNGNGRPLGFAVDTSVTTASIEGTTGHTVSNTSGDAGSATKIMTLEGGLPDAYWSRARWFVAGSVHAKINALSGPGGTGWAFDSSETSSAGEPLLLGHPVSRSSAMQADGAANNRVLALCDLSQYVVASRAVLSLRVLREPFGDLDQTLFVLQDRIGGVLAVPAACVVGTV